MVAGSSAAPYLGYHIGAPFARQGYMREALGRCCAGVRSLRLHRVEANIHSPQNRASIALVKRLAFDEKGIRAAISRSAGGGAITSGGPAGR